MEKFGLLQLLSTFAKNMQADESANTNEQSIFDIFADNKNEQTTTQQQATTATQTERQPQNTQTTGSIFTSDYRQKQFNSILLRHEEISRRIDKRNKH